MSHMSMFSMYFEYVKRYRIENVANLQKFEMTLKMSYYIS